MSLDLLAALAAGYFLGGLPTALLVARLQGRDIFGVGSGNMGAMNTARNVGWLAGAVVLVVDMGKGALAAALGAWMATAAGRPDTLALALAGSLGAVIGHAWSPYARFRGGKALATIFGAGLVVAPPAALFTGLLLIALTLLLRRTTAAALLTLALYPLVTGAALMRAGWVQERIFAAVTAAGLVALVSIVKHLLAARATSRARRQG